jgi:acetyltransferase-like isoleucine patch superfamily enzyme
MGFGITKLLRRLQISWNVNEFCIRRKLLGFENANGFLRRLDKHSMIPILKRNGGKIGKNCDIEAPLIFHNCSDFSNLIIGNDCHLGKNCFFDLRDKVIIEDNVVVSMQATFITHIDLNKSDLHFLFPATHSPIRVGKNSFIGAGTTILKGVTLADNCIVAAGSVVTKKVDPCTMVGGAPAKFIKKIKLEDNRLSE